MRNVLLLAMLASCSCYSTTEVVVNAKPFPVEYALNRTYKVVVDCAKDDMDSGGSAVDLGDGYAVTAKHVVDPWDSSCVITLSNSRGTWDGYLMAKHPNTDLAIIVTSRPPLAFTPFAKPVLGEPIMAVGYPDSVLSVTYGNVAAERDGDGDVRFTAPTYYGSSGGGIWDGSGRLVGISVSGFFNRPSWFFLVPSDRIQELM